MAGGYASTLVQFDKFRNTIKSFLTKSLTINFAYCLYEGVKEKSLLIFCGGGGVLEYKLVGRE